MIRKHAELAVLDAWRVPAGTSKRALVKAAHRVSFAYTPRPGYLYVRARAISSRTNDNWDTFPAEEIEKGYRTFLGKPCFINHHNSNHRRARGVIVAAAIHRDRNPDGSPDTWVELLHEIDAQVFPKFAKAVLTGRVNRTSMGVDCEHSTCSACGNKATSPAEYCQHMPGKKGMKFRKRGSDGKVREGIIHEICAGLTFFENSFLVEDPADPSAFILDKPYLHATASVRKAASAAADADNAYELTGCHHTSCGRTLHRRRTARVDIIEDRLHHPADPATEPSRLALAGARAYSATAGLPDPHTEPYSRIETNPDRIRRLAHAYDALPMNDPGAHAAFADMARQVHRQYHHLTQAMGVDVRAVHEDPYENHQQMVDDLNRGRLRVLSTAATGPHSFFDDETNDKFRAVHDAFGHAATGRSFDRHGEEAAWLAHSRMFAGPARHAMTTETRGQNSMLIATGRFAPQKTALLDPSFLRRDAALAAAPSLLAHFGGRKEEFTAARRFFEQPLYHGTRSLLAPGEHLTVDQARRAPNNPDLRTDPYVHATTDPAEAYRWGQRASGFGADVRAEELGRQRRIPPGGNQDQAYPPRVYRVRPTGPVEPDLEYADTEHDSYRSPHAMRVHEEVHPLACWAGECGNAEHWPDHPHYPFLKAEQDAEDERQQHAAALRAQARPRYENPADHPWFKAIPLDKDNIKAAWYDSTDDEKAQGKNWYPDAHLVAKSIAHGDAALGAGLLSAYSPRTKWPANMFHAARTIHLGRALSHSLGDGPVMDMHTRPAARILAGEHHSQVLNGPKTRSFATLIEHGGQDPEDTKNGVAHVVVDRHAMSVAAGRRLTDHEAVSMPVDKQHYYNHVEQKYLDAADEVSRETGKKVTPEHMQATTWLRQVRVNDAEDSVAGNAFGGGGRVQKGINDLRRWQEHVRQHHPEMEGQTMHASLQHTAADPPLRVPPSVDTLRPEACPVCGDQDVFKGQRCPVCGFVAPPDIFRDPDIDAARLNRQELEEGKETSPLPEGPADEQMAVPGAEPGMNPEPIGSGEDAQDQLLHPDQIAPDGVPGVQPDATAPGQGMLEPTGDEEELAGPGELDENGHPAGEPALEGEEEIDEANPEGAAVREDAEAQEDEAMAEQLGGKAEGEEEAAEEEEEAASPGKDQDEDERPGGKKMTKQRTAATAAVTAQQRVIDELRRENASLHAGLAFIASLAGVTEELDAVLKEADLANPAQPVPDPPQAPPTSTTEQALETGAPTGSGNATVRGPGHTEDDPSRPGATPGSMTAVPAELTTTPLTPGVEIPTAPAGNLQDVTAPVQGTNPSQDGGVPIEQRRIETDVRVNPNPLAAQGPGIGGQGTDGTAFPWTIAARQTLQSTAALSPEDERGARTFACIRLARLRVQAGLARGDELELSTIIEKDASLTLRDIEHEIGTLGQVSKAAAVAQAQPRYPRTMAPRTASRAAPSFSGEPAPAMAMTAHVNGFDSDDGDLFD